MTGGGSVATLVDEGLERGYFAGASAVVATATELLLNVTAGEARVEPEGERFPVKEDTLWDLASLTKPLAGAGLVLGLAETGAFSLEDGISRFSDRLKKTRFSGVTLGRLLAHTAGLEDWFPCYVRGEGRDAYLRCLAEVDPGAPPGLSVTYSCLGYLLLSHAVETASGLPLDALFRARVAVPLGLERDLLFSPEGEDRLRAAGGETDDGTERRMVAERGLRYAGFRTGVVNGEVNDGNAYRRGNGVSLNAGLFGTARGVLGAARAWLQRDSRLLSEASVVEAVTDATPALGEPRGLGWELATAANAAGPALSARAFGHTGFTGTSVWVDPAAEGEGRIYILLTNRLHPFARPVDMNAFRRRFHESASRI